MVTTFPVPTLDSERTAVRRRKQRRIVLLATVPIVLIAAFLTGSAFLRSQTGDPGGRVLAQLTPVLSAVPADAHTVHTWKTEPRRDSCDGIAGTQGWDPVVVQSDFSWTGSGTALGLQMNERLAAVGWKMAPEGPSYGQPSWSRTLNNGTRADLSVSFQGPNQWELVAQAPPVGKAASGC